MKIPFQSTTQLIFLKMISAFIFALYLLTVIFWQPSKHTLRSTHTCIYMYSNSGWETIVTALMHCYIIDHSLTHVFNECSDTYLYIVIHLVDAISVQLTGPSQPPADVDLATINEFIRVRSVPPPSWAVEGVANELAMLSVVKDTWRNVSSNSMSEYVIRR